MNRKYIIVGNGSDFYNGQKLVGLEEEECCNKFLEDILSQGEILE